MSEQKYDFSGMWEKNKLNIPQINFKGRYNLNSEKKFIATHNHIGFYKFFANKEDAIAWIESQASLRLNEVLAFAESVRVKK